MSDAVNTESGGPRTPEGSAWEVLWVFLRLGLTSFGGPVAHLGYFRTEFVERRAWLDERSYAELVALCQFLPGPASSQVGIAVGLARGGWWGSLAAWVGFTLPSAALLIAFAIGLARYETWLGSGALQGLKVVAVAVVAQAVWGMAKAFCTDLRRAALAAAAAALMLAWPSAAAQGGVIAVCALAGRWMLQPAAAPAVAQRPWPVSRRAGFVALGVFLGLLLGLPLLVTGLESGWASPLWSPVWSPVVAMLDAFYRAGALVFGGGHVVLPLLQSAVVPGGQVSASEFVAGYGAAQAVPGPLFTFAAYLGAAMDPPFGGWVGGLVCLLAIFLPAWLLVVGALPFWNAWRHRPEVQTALAGINAGVVGLLAAAWVDPVWSSAIRGGADLALAVACFALLMWARWSPLAVVTVAALAGWAFL
jgi:chromate transporter